LFTISQFDHGLNAGRQYGAGVAEVARVAEPEGAVRKPAHSILREHGLRGPQRASED
jgi:hypothetical protein